jgi:hypothetical protein
VGSGLISWDVTDIVKAWVNSGEDNFGFIIRLTDESGSNYDQQFASSTYYDSESRPILDVQYPYYDVEQNGVPVNTLNIPVGSTFTVDVWIRNTPSIGLEGFLLIVFWNPTMMELTSYQQAPNTKSWGQWDVAVQTVGTANIHLQGGNSGGNYITSDMIYLTLTFRCLSQGSSEMSMGDGYLDIVGQEQNVLPLDFHVTCNQLSRASSNPYHYVGGKVFSANKLAVLAPYLALFGVIGFTTTIAATLIVKTKRK